MYRPTACAVRCARAILYSDSEIAVLVSGGRQVECRLGESPFMAFAFARSLRLSLWHEHLGLQLPIDPVVDLISSPVGDAASSSVFHTMWRARALHNTEILTFVFKVSH